MSTASNVTSEERLLFQKNLQQHDFSRDVKLRDVKDSLSQLYRRYKQVTGAYKAANALTTSSTTDSPETTLMNLKLLFDGLRAFMPSVPGFSAFLTLYSEAIGRAATALGVLAKRIRQAEAGVMVLHPGSWEGGWPMYNYMLKLETATYPVEVPDDIIAWVKSNRESLSFITRVPPPAERRFLFGLDILYPDFVDRAALKQWLFNYRVEVRKFIYGDTPFHLLK